MKIFEKIHNVETNEVTLVEREETPLEKAEREAFEAKIAEDAKLLAEKEIARQALLDKLGITSDEAKLLLS